MTVMSHPATNECPVLTVLQVAEMLSCSKWHVQRLINSGKLAAIDISSQGSRPKIRVRRVDLDAYLSASALPVI